MLQRQSPPQADRLAKLLERGAYSDDRAVRADWTGETQAAKFQGAAQADRLTFGRKGR